MSNWREQIADGAVLLTVNQRLSRHQMERYQRWQLQQGHQWWETPAILPFRSWVSATHAQAVLMGLSESSLLSPLIVQRAWYRIIDSDTSVALLDTAGAARSALAAWELSCAWKCENSEEHYLSADQFAWQRWMKRYRSWADAQQGVDEAQLAEVLAQVVLSASDEQRQALLPRNIILDGFIQLPAQLQQLVDTLRECGTQVEQRESTPRAVVHTLSYVDDDTELSSIAAQMRAELEHDPMQSLALVVPDLQQRRDAVVRAFERVFYPAMSPLQIEQQTTAYEISLGQSLSDQPVISTALMLLRLCAHSISGNEVSATLLSPYSKGAVSERRRREQLDRRLRDKRVYSLSIEQLRDALYKDSEFKPACNKLISLRRLKPAQLGEWAARFSLWLKTLGWPGKSIATDEYQAVSAWMECLDDMQLLDDGASVSFSAAFTQLKTLAVDRVFQLETPAKPIQVMGRLESHGLEFDGLWIAGLDGEQWPPTSSPTAFLAINEQKACGVPNSSAAGRLVLAEKEFRQWASQTPLLVASCAQAREGKQLSAALLPEHKPDEKSIALAKPRLERLQHCLLPEDPVTLIAQALQLVTLEDTKGPALEAGTPVGGGARLFENQALCPFRAFALHRLKIRPLEEAGIGLDPRQQGTLLHQALENFWRAQVTHEALLELSAESLDGALESAIAQAMEETDVPENLRALELTRLTRLLREWVVNCEMPRAPFTVVAFEQKQTIEHGGVVMDVIIDRIDSVGVSNVVIDYKTGVSSKVAPWGQKRISNPQLPLYVLTDEQIEAASFAQVSVNQCKFLGIASEEQVLPKVSTKLRATKGFEDSQHEPPTSWPQWRAHWQDSFDVIAAEVRRGVATVTPMKSACTYCELKSMCRIDTQTLNADELDRGESDGQDAGASL